MNDKITNESPSDELYKCTTEQIIDALLNADITVCRKSVLLHFIVERAKRDADMHNKISRVSIGSILGNRLKAEAKAGITLAVKEDQQ